MVFRSLKLCLMFSFLICIGKYNANPKNAFQKDIQDIYEVPSLVEAVDTASFLAKHDDIVLFSPACKSDDENETYAERGQLFTDTVKELENNEHHQQDI